MFGISLWQIIAAGIANILLGFIWYHPKVFGTTWMRLTPISPDTLERSKRRMPIIMVVSFGSAMLAAYVMSHFGAAWGVFDWIGAVELAFWLWAGFVVPAMLSSVLWDGKPLRLFVINVFYWLVALIVMAIILVL